MSCCGAVGVAACAHAEMRRIVGLHPPDDVVRNRCCVVLGVQIATHFVTLGFFCLLLPLVIITPEVTTNGCLGDPACTANAMSYIGMSYCMCRHAANHANLHMCYRLTSICSSQITVPIFAIVHLPSIITLSTAWFTPGGWMYIIMCARKPSVLAG